MNAPRRFPPPWSAEVTPNCFIVHAANRGKCGNAGTDAGSVMRKVVLLLGTLALADCAAQTIYLRTDGLDIASNPALRQQLDRDRIACQGEPGDDQDCMATKGYVSVRQDQAAAKQQQLAAIAAENAEREAVAVLPPPTPTRPHKTAAVKKRKSKPPEITLRSSQN
jgi:hypothetical protein